MNGLCEYSMVCLVAQHPWTFVMVAAIIIFVLMLPRRISVASAGRQRIVYESPFVRYVRRVDGWDISFPIIARVQHELQRLLGWFWQRAVGMLRAQLWGMLRDWLKRWLA
jgi:hypothetical protein